jgi:hypothetical protein
MKFMVATLHEIRLLENIFLCQKQWSNIEICKSLFKWWEVLPELLFIYINNHFNINKT